ncbi:MAG: HAD-IC family P-type ATPase [Traorella sp.]
MDSKKISIDVGLNDKEVSFRVSNGLNNVVMNTTTKSYKQIIYDNIFTLFNLINVILAVLIFITGSYKNMAFLGVMISNIIIGMFQEIRAKRTLDKISLIHTMKVCAIRNKKECQIGIEEIVIDDILKINAGNQIPSDCIIRKGSIEVDESLLTGESELVHKTIDDQLFSGSYVISGMAYVQVIQVGENNYASKIVNDAKKQSKYPSELRDTLNKIIKYIGMMILPLGIIIFCKQTLILQETFQGSILGTSAALIGMIPEGLVILTSIALAISVIHLSKQHTLVQELYCIETLARVDILCLDKTGTITEGEMNVDSYETNHPNFEEIMKNLAYDLTDENPTIKAIKAKFKPTKTYQCEKIIPFNSKNKYSGVIYSNNIYLIGAYQYITKNPNSEELKHIESYSSQGYRVISVFQTTKEDENFQNVKLIGNIYLLDKIRQDAYDTLKYFKQQNVDIKIISGDHPLTVYHIGKRVGLENAENYIDMTSISNEEIDDISEKYTIFGRVTPIQKKLLIQSLKKHGHCVGMSGDGVNDVLAFKEANISIAMNSGSDIAKSSANLVLLDSNFDALPSVLYEGRRVINNIQRVATLFLTKTIFSALLTVITIFLPFEYPFEPIHLTFVSSFTIGIPAFLMALEPNKKRVENSFLSNIINISLPSAISVIITMMMIYVMSSFQNYSEDMITQLALITIAINGCIVLVKVSIPITPLRKYILIGSFICIILGLACFEDLLSIIPINITKIIFELITICSILIVTSELIKKIIDIIKNRYDILKKR